jgi:hypothetical protein
VAPTAVGPIQVEVGASVLASVVAGGVAPAAMAQVALIRPDAPFALGLGVLAVGAHAAAVLPGSAIWRRLGGVVELQSQGRWRSVQLQLHAGLALSALAIDGESLPVTRSAVIFDPGVVAGLRLRVRAGRLLPWLEATAVSWPRAHSVYLQGSAASTPLPSFEALLGVGLAFESRIAPRK